VIGNELTAPLKFCLSAFAAIVPFAFLLTAGIAVGDQPKKPCHEHPKLVGPCFTVHARMRYYNGAPPIRLWPIGTDRFSASARANPLRVTRACQNLSGRPLIVSARSTPTSWFVPSHPASRT
jgi:hypothetical protein